MGEPEPEESESPIPRQRRAAPKARFVAGGHSLADRVTPDSRQALQGHVGHLAPSSATSSASTSPTQLIDQVLGGWDVSDAYLATPLADPVLQRERGERRQRERSAARLALCVRLVERAARIRRKRRIAGVLLHWVRRYNALRWSTAEERAEKRRVLQRSRRAERQALVGRGRTPSAPTAPVATVEESSESEVEDLFGEERRRRSCLLRRGRCGICGRLCLRVARYPPFQHWALKGFIKLLTYLLVRAPLGPAVGLGVIVSKAPALFIEYLQDGDS